MRKINRAVKIRIYPNAEQRVQIDKTIGCSRFIYNCMLADKMEHYKKEKKMLRNTPASYKKEYPWLKEVDSLALANVQMHLESAFHKFFREPSAGFPRFKSKKSSRKSYTTNVVNGNIFLEGKYLKLPKMTAVRIKLHRPVSEKWKLKSVTVSREPSGKYFASLLFCCENQTAEKRPAEKFIGIDFAMQGMCVFSTGKRAEYPMFYRNTEKKLAREQRKLSRCQKGSQNYKKQKKRVALCHEKIRNQRKDFQHKLSASLAESYDAVCVEDLNLKGMAGGLHLGKGVHDNGYGLFLSMLEYKLEERGKYLIKVDRYFASSRICSACGKKKEKLSLSERIYYCECGHRMDRDVNAAVNIMNLAVECGEPVYNMNEEGIEEVKPMHAVLELEGVKESLDEDLIFALNTIFCSKFGFNMRNNVAHGMLDDQAFQSFKALYIWWFALKFCYLFCGKLQEENRSKINKKLKQLMEKKDNMDEN